MEIKSNVRTRYLRQCVNNGEAVNVILRNGFQMPCTITDFGDKTVAVVADGSISTIEPLPVARSPHWAAGAFLPR